MAEHEKNNVPETKTTEKSNKKKLSLWKKVAIGFVGFIVLLFVVVSIATSGATKVSDEFMSSLLNNKPTAAYELFSTEAMNEVPKDQFESVVGQMSDVLDETAKQTSKSVESETGTGSTGTVTYEVDGSDGTYEIIVELVKEDGEWKVLNFDSSRK